MKFIGFLDTFFILSLGITFVLLLVLVYHFRKRLNENESKYEKLLSIVNDIVQKLNEQQLPPGGNVDPNLYLNMPGIVMNNNTTISDNWEQVNTLNEPNTITMVNDELNESGDEEEVGTFTGEDEEGSEEEGSEEEGSDEEGSEEEESDEEGSDEEGSEEEESDEEESDEEELKEVKKINITDDKVDVNIDTEEIDDNEPIDEKEVNLDAEPLTDIDPIKVDKTDIVDYSSMTVNDLRKIVKEKELATNVSKLKKNELIDLLT